MANVELAGTTYTIDQNETVLDGLLRQGVPVANSCKAGACQCCMMRAVEGPVPPQAQVGLKSSLKEQGYFLSCQCRPADDLVLEAPGDDLQFETQIIELEDLGASVMRVALVTPEGFSYRAGQFLTLLSPDGVARSYSLASLPSDGTLELHIRRIPGGLMSTWIFEQARPGDVVRIAGPSGDCFYTDGDSCQPMLLVGTGTGLAPLWGVLRDALARGHTGQIVLYHGAVDMAGLYHREQLAAMAEEFGQFIYRPCVMRDGDDTVSMGKIDEVVLSEFPTLKGWRGFLCGNPDLVKMLKKKFFLAGMNMKEIYADAFVPSATPAAK